MACSIQKMSIAGIRSYGTDKPVVITFYHPLTVIVGNNGSGKTTIIECLKMSCTGELPPNTRSGQSFIHDPKIAGATEVKAQIKLKFQIANRQNAMVIRSFQLTQKKSTMQFKALDNTLQTINPVTGQVEALSYRCADIDKVVPAMLGVSKAVLENVIFVHQEDSNWPLAEGQVLKKRFDDIFAATRYTKALEELRKLKTRQAQEAKEMKLKLEHLKTHKDHAARLRTDVDTNEKKAEHLTRDVSGLQTQLQTLNDEKAAINAQLNSLADLGDSIKELQAKHSMLTGQNADAYARLVASYQPEDLTLSIEELMEWEQSMRPEMDTQQGTIHRLERDLNSSKLEADAFKAQVGDAVKVASRLAAEAEAHSRNVAERDRFIRHTTSQLGLGALPGDDSSRPLSDSNVAAFHTSFKGKLDAAIKSFEDRRLLHQREDDEHGRGIDRISAQIGGFDETTRMKEQQMRANDLREEQLQSQRAGLSASSEAVELAADREKAMAARLAAKEEELKNATNDAGLQQHEAFLLEVQRRTADLRNERQRLAGAADQAARMNYKAQELADAQAKADAYSSRNKARLMLLLEASVVPVGDQLRMEVETRLRAREQRARHAQEVLGGLQTSLAAARGSLQAKTELFQKAEAELESLRKRLADSGKSHGAVGQERHQLEETQNTAQARLQQAEAFKVIVDSYCSFATDHNACAVCQRAFSTREEAASFLERQNAERQSLPTKTASLKAQLAAVQQQLASLKELEPIAARFDKLDSEEIPSLKADVDKLRLDIEGLESQKRIAESEKNEADAAVSDARTMLHEVVVPMEKLATEIKSKTAEIDLLRSAVAADDATRTVADVDAELTELESKRNATEHAKQAALTKLNMLREELSSLRDQVHKAKEETNRLKSAAARSAELAALINELNESSSKLAAELVERKQQKEPLERQREALIKERESNRVNARSVENELQSELRKLQGLESQLETRERTLREYSERGSAEALDRATKSLDELRERQEKAEKNVERLQAELQDARNEATNVEGIIRQVRDILAYRQSKHEEESLAAQIDSRRAEMSTVGDHASLQRMFVEVEEKEVRVRSEKDRALGTLAAVQDAADRAAAELRSPQYADIDAKYRKQLIELRTTEMASGDLEKYHKALEKALLSFHTTKMADINAIIRELWQKTYRNTDIDYIKIKADTEGSAARSYNYRVVMSCGGAELDMRGRCSAGQKVLACLIIRLALAETFCLNCGILALDEPTTNLDTENSQSLADSLRAIMASRKDQENFQLIVITHDESFARRIGTRENTECILRVHKDEHQCSRVVVEEVSD